MPPKHMALIAFATLAAAGLNACGSDTNGAKKAAAEQMFGKQCASCHGASGEGGQFGPAVSGAAFKAKWPDSQKLAAFIKQSMPPSMPGSLTTQEASMLAALLQGKLESGASDGNADAPTFVDDMQSGHVGPKPAAPEIFNDDFATMAKADRERLLAAVRPVTEATLASPEPADWLNWRRSTDATGFSPLAQITTQNVSGLRVAWSWALPVGGNQVAPIVRDCVMFVSSGGSVQALDASSGTLLWNYTRPMDAGGRAVPQKNISIYGNAIYAATGDRHVIALDARTGKLLWDKEILPPGGVQPILSAGPLVVEGRVIQGISLGPACERGCALIGLDAKSGAEVWRFATTAKAGTPGGNSWNGAPDEDRTGGAVWVSPSYDPETGLVYAGVSGTYQVTPLLRPANRKPGSTDALYTNSTVALNAKTGKLVWHHQHMPRDLWDMDESFERILTTVSDRSGKPVPALLTMGKVGILDALDRRTGAYLFSWDAGLQNIVTSIDPRTGRRTFNPALEPVEGKTYDVCPSPEGVRNWMASSYDRQASVLYLPLEETCMDFAWSPSPAGSGRKRKIDIGWSVKPHPGSQGKYGRVVALDVKTRRPLWIRRTRPPLSSSLLATAGGLLFSGYRDRVFHALDAKNGSVLWDIRLNAVPNATPISYAANGRQFIAITTGGGSPHDKESQEITPEIMDASPTTTLWVFSLDAKAGK